MMDALRRLFGGGGSQEPRSVPTGEERVGQEPRSSADEQALERYRYLLRTAPPETIEEAHAEAFAQLTPEQRRMVLEELTRELPEHERAGDVRYEDDPRSLARLATRTEMRQSGALERSFGGMGSQSWARAHEACRPRGPGSIESSASTACASAGLMSRACWQ